MTKYVKHGKEKEESYVEVDIFDNDEVHTVRRTIDSEKKSSKWKYNHNEAKQIQIKDLMKKLKIDVENLCNFMSQDKVGTFSTFKANLILQTTLKCINLNSDSDEEKTLYDEQVALADVENDKRDKEQEKDTKQTVYDEFLNQLILMQREYDRFIERSETKKKLELYEIKLVFQQIKEMSNKVKEKQVLVDQATKLLLDAERAIQPLELRERELKKLQAIKAKNVDNSKEKMNTSERTMLSRKEDIAQAELTLDSVYTDLQLMDQQRKKIEDSRKVKIDDLKKAEKELLDLSDRLPEIHLKLEALSVDIRDIATRQEACQLAYDEKDGKLRNKKEELNGVKREIGNLKDSTEIFQRKVQSTAPHQFRQDTIKLISLLRDQQQWKIDNKISHEIYGPISMYINVKDHAAAAMVEKCIPNNKLYGVIVQSDKDRIFLKRIFNERNMRVDIYTMYDINPSEGALVKNIAKTHEDIGMQGYLIDQVETNRVVRSFLISNIHLHTVLWIKQSPGTRDINDKDTSSFMGTGRFYKFFKYQPELSKGMDLYIQEYSGSMSRYARDGKVNVSVSKVEKTGFIICGSPDSSNDIDKKNLETRHNTLVNEINFIESERKILMEKSKELSDERNDRQDKRRTLLNAVKQPEIARSKISSLQKQINELDQKLSSDINADRREKQAAYRNALSKLLSNIELLLVASNTYHDFKVDCMIAFESKKALSVDVDKAADAVREAKMGLEQFKQEVRLCERNREDVELQKIKFSKKLDDLSEKHSGAANLQVLFAKAVSDLPETTVDDIEQKVAYLDQELKGAVDNSSIVERYKITEAKVAKAKVELDALTSACNNKRDFFNERSVHWKHSITTLATKMSASFKTFMNQLQYDGAVKLRPTGSIMEYEMVMEVCFKINSTMVELSGHKHSGGERAVSTIMYLMAMQALTTSPFRVVDEINQGMDERNERLVFDRIVSTCCGNLNMPQYFLVSPKLLQGLNAMDHPDVTVLLVLNGPGVKSTWNLKDVITGLKRKLDVDSIDIGKENNTSHNKKVKSARG